MATVKPIKGSESLSESESKLVKQRLAKLEQRLYRGSVLNWDCWQSRDIKQLAGNVRTISELALLAHKGLRATLDNGGTCSVDEAEWTILDDLMEMATLGSFVLARELGAAVDTREPKDGA